MEASMRHLALLLLGFVFTSPFALAAQNPDPIRLCVALLENHSHSAVTSDWQQKELIRALERTNTKKEVKKGAAARITPIAIDSSSDPNTMVQKESCDFVLNTELIDVHPVGTGGIGTSVPGAIGTGVTIGKVDEPPDMRRLIHDATVNYRIMRVGELHSWALGIVTERDTVTEDALVSRLMNQIAGRAANDLRNPHPSTPD
jgi:hypothetical protein